MGRKATYSELVQRVNQLETEASEGKRAEEKLKENEQRLKVQYKHIPIPTYTWRKSEDDLVLTDFNDAAEKITQGKIVDYVGIKASDMYGEAPEILNELRRCFSERTVNEREMPYKFISTGEEKVLNVKYAFVPPDSVVVHTEDVTSRVEAERKLKESYELLERRVEERTAELKDAVERLKQEMSHREQAEKALRKSEERFRGLVQDMPSLLCRFLPDGTLTFVNDRYCDYFNMTTEGLIGQNFFQFIPEESRQKVREQFTSLNEQNPMITYEHKVIGPDGSRRWQEWTDRVLVDEEGRPKEYQSIGIDITERKRGEQRLQDAKVLLEKTLASLDEAVFVINPTTRTIMSCNPAVESVFGYAEEEVVGRRTEFLHVDPAMYKEFGRGVDQALDKGGVYKGEFKMKRKDGTTFFTEHTVREISDDSGNRTGSVSVVRDITEEKRREQELRTRGEQLEERTRNLEQLNTALKVLLDKRDQDIKELEDKVLSNMKQLVVPFLEKFRNSGLSERQKTYLEIVESNLNDVISPFVRKLSAVQFGLTPTEIRVANLVKEGRTTKEIAQILNSSARAIEFHRGNLRKKLGLNERKINLRTYLLSAS
jgi:PAS domain S-box-containing protein